MLHTIIKVPEEFTLHEAPMFQSYGIEFVGGDAWEEVDNRLSALAIRATDRGHKMELVLTTGVFGSPQCEPNLRSKLSSFAEQGTVTFLHGPLTYNYARGPF